ncbi:roadblock/LC7 domain-containing protein [Methanopyrus kandleri]|uniref:Roadblock/LC7 domain-containing protein n=1 Tax=Methanopyrus kandleri TaxID=2320 RepID=A0A832WRT2_9EURY|nr:roadblock/LC7 domain-containing protein [Methanopyrus kandleri]HII70476.1 roadblock/LC7 domain-containing protein [Methanopyrus kandleri]
MKLDDVVKEHGVLCAFVATEDGFVVDAASDTDIDPEESAALAADRRYETPKRDEQTGFGAERGRRWDHRRTVVR